MFRIPARGRMALLTLALLSAQACKFEDVAAKPSPSPDAVQQDAAAVGGDSEQGTDQPFQADPDQVPFGIHATWQRDPATTLTFSWTTKAMDVAKYQPRVWFAPVSVAGKDGKNLPFEAANLVAGSGKTYDTVTGDPPTAVTWAAELTGLQPDTEYVYRVGTYKNVDLAAKTFEEPNWSPPAIIRTAPQKGDRKPYTFVMAGDSRGGGDNIRANMKRQAPLVGYQDLEALAWFFNGDFNPFGSQTEWNDWFDAMAPVLHTRVLMPVQGNHEVLADVYYAQFELPQVAAVPMELREHVWSLDIGNIHFVGLDSNTTENVSNEDVLAWLKADLEAADKDAAIDWTIVMMHHPAYSACTNHGSTDRVQKYWVPLFEAHGVDLVFAGHDHDYERTKPIRASQVAESGTAPVYVVAGAFHNNSPYTNGLDWWSEKSSHGSKSNYVVLQVNGKTIQMKALAGDGAEVLDEVTFSH